MVKPFAVSLGAASPANASGGFDEENYSLSVSGEAELGRLLRVAQALGVGSPGIGLEGGSKIDLQVGGPWMGFAEPTATGKVQVGTATAELQGISEPLVVDSATVLLQGPLVNITSFSASFTKGGQFNGSATFPIHCAGPETCMLSFIIKAEDTSLARLNHLFNPEFSRQPWYRLLASNKRHDDVLSKLRAQGHFSMPSFDLGDITATNVTALWIFPSASCEFTS